MANGGAENGANSNSDKVTLYSGMDCQPQAVGCWSLNSLITVEPRFATRGGLGATVSEFDLNNNDANAGEAEGIVGAFSTPIVEAIGITGAGNKRSTGAIDIGGPGDHTIWNRGILIKNNSVEQCSICDYGVAEITLDIRGQHNAGVDTHLMTGANDYVARNSGVYGFENAAGTAVYQGMTGGSDNRVYIGGTASGVAWYKDLKPIANKTQALGDTTHQLKSIFSQNAFVSGSIFFDNPTGTPFVALSFDGRGNEIIGVNTLNSIGWYTQLRPMTDNSQNIGDPLFRVNTTYSSFVKLSAIPTRSLPTCDAETAGKVGAVVDASSYDGVLTGGGSVSIPVFCNGSSWLPYQTRSLGTPASSTAACAPGQFVDDANFHYVCVATNTWKRASLKPFSPVTVASLPLCDTSKEGAVIPVSDAKSPNYNGALSGGGRAHVPAYCNGSAWVAH